MFFVFFFPARPPLLARCVAGLSNFNLKNQLPCIVTLFPTIIEKATWGYNQVPNARKRHEEFSMSGCYFLNGAGREKIKVFLLTLFFFSSSLPASPFVSSEGCTLGGTLIKIFAPGALFASCSTSGASERQIQIIGCPGQVM